MCHYVFQSVPFHRRWEPGELQSVEKQNRIVENCGWFKLLCRLREAMLLASPNGKMAFLHCSFSAIKLLIGACAPQEKRFWWQNGYRLYSAQHTLNFSISDWRSLIFFEKRFVQFSVWKKLPQKPELQTLREVWSKMCRVLCHQIRVIHRKLFQMECCPHARASQRHSSSERSLPPWPNKSRDQLCCSSERSEQNVSSHSDKPPSTDWQQNKTFCRFFQKNPIHCPISTILWY